TDARAPARRRGRTARRRGPDRIEVRGRALRGRGTAGRHQAGGARAKSVRPVRTGPPTGGPPAREWPPRVTRPAARDRPARGQAPDTLAAAQASAGTRRVPHSRFPAAPRAATDPIS